MDRKLLGAALATLSLMSFTTPTASAAVPQIRMSAQLGCVASGGAILELRLSNPGRGVVRIDPDLHLRLEIIRQGRQPGVILFVFPAPTHATIPPHEARTFTLDLGTEDEASPALDLSGSRLLIELEVWLAGRKAPVRRTLSFPAC